MKKVRLTRSVPLVARTGLARTTELKRTPFRSVTPLPSGGAHPSPDGPVKARKPMSPAERDARDVVGGRSDGWCEIQLPGCFGRASNWHHRKNRSQGGSWAPENGLAVCGSGSTGCHGLLTNPNGRTAEFRDSGWLVRRGDDPADIPVLIAGRGFVLLGPTEDYIDLPAEIEPCPGAAFTTEMDAAKAVHLIQTKPLHNLKGKRAKRPPRSYYRCRRCDLWHLSCKEAS